MFSKNVSATSQAVRSGLAHAGTNRDPFSFRRILSPERHLRRRLAAFRRMAIGGCPVFLKRIGEIAERGKVSAPGGAGAFPRGLSSLARRNPARRARKTASSPHAKFTERQLKKSDGRRAGHELAVALGSPPFVVPRHVRGAERRGRLAALCPSDFPP